MENDKGLSKGKPKEAIGDSKQKKQKRSREEIELDRINKQVRKEERLKKREEREKEKARKAEAREKPPSEKELVHKYVNRVINNQKYHGRVDSEKFQGIAYEKKVNKNLWMDNDFFFSVVFQSAEQKYKFLEAVGVYAEDMEIIDSSKKIQIVNGLEFSERLGIPVEIEEANEYPVGNLDLMPYVLDTVTNE